MSSNYGTIREFHDDPGYREYQDTDAASSVSDLTEEIRTNIFKINNGANGVERAMKLIGTDRDSSELRDRVHDISQKTNKVIQTTTKLLRTAATKRADKQQKIQLDILKGNFQEAVQGFQTVQKKAADKVKSAVQLGAPSTKSQTLVGFEENTGDQARLMQEETQVQMLKEQEVVIEDDLVLIREREERIRQLESDILDVNEVFKDLGALVHEQGETLDTIDNNIESAAGNVESGNEQLLKAREYQRKSRKKMCCLLIIIIIIVAIIAIVLAVSLK